MSLSAREVRGLTEDIDVQFIGVDQSSAWVKNHDTGGSHYVNLIEETCSCPDFKYNTDECKHLTRAKAERGEWEYEDGD